MDWDQQENEAGYIYFVNKRTGDRQNDHPKFSEIMQMVHDRNKCIKYVAYRCATKLWLLKQSFYTVNIPYSFVTSVLNHFGLNQCDNAPALKPAQLTSLLHDIYFAAEKCGYFAQSVHFNLERSIAMMANLLWSIFVPHRSVPISLLEFKQLMLMMCNTHTYDQLILEEFLIVADHNRCVNRFRFESMLKVISKIFSFLGESVHYGWHLVTDWVAQCFRQCPGMIGLDEYQFTCLWQNQNIHFASYANVLALVHRIKEAQNILHDVHCVACKQTPIKGIRFKCQQCRNLSLCFECFCKGYTNAKHEIAHRMYEMSSVQTKSDRFLWIFSKLWFCRRTNAVEMQNETNHSLETKIADDKNQTTGTTTIDCINDTKFQSIRKVRQLKDASATPAKAMKLQRTQQLDEIIDAISQQANEMKEFLSTTATRDNGNDDARHFLRQQQIFMSDVVIKLRGIATVDAGTTANRFPHASTPYRTAKNKKIVEVSPGSPLRSSIRGAAINKSFLENQRSDLSIGDLSTWFHLRDTSGNATFAKTPDADFVLDPIDQSIDTKMTNFRGLLMKLREIMDDSYSDNTALSSATCQLEHALDDIIQTEERKRVYV